MRLSGGSGSARSDAREQALVALVRRTLGATTDVAWTLRTPSGWTATFGPDAPSSFTVTIHDAAGIAALRSLDELRICEAYMDQHLDLDGDLRAAVKLRRHLADGNRWITLWRRLEPLLVGRARARARWVREHYDADDLQLHFLDATHHAYTQGAFLDDDEPLEAAIERKLARAFASTALRAGDRVLDVGFGWGPFVRHAARRGVRVTGLTLSRNQLTYVQHLLDAERLDARLLLCDFFAHRPEAPYDAVVACGVLEELADYDAVMKSLARWLKPGGKAYLDFSSAAEDFVLPAFVSKHVFRGRTSRVHLPKLLAAVAASGLELSALHDDRRNYFLTTTRWYEAFEQKSAATRAQHGERAFRLFRLYLAANPVMLEDPSRFGGAYRMLLARPLDT